MYQKAVSVTVIDAISSSVLHLSNTFPCVRVKLVDSLPLLYPLTSFYPHSSLLTAPPHSRPFSFSAQINTWSVQRDNCMLIDIVLCIPNHLLQPPIYFWSIFADSHKRTRYHIGLLHFALYNYTQRWVLFGFRFMENKKARKKGIVEFFCCTRLVVSINFQQERFSRLQGYGIDILLMHNYPT